MSSRDAGRRRKLFDGEGILGRWWDPESWCELPGPPP
jgi:hypothetical protein